MDMKEQMLHIHENMYYNFINMVDTNNIQGSAFQSFGQEVHK